MFTREVVQEGKCCSTDCDFWDSCEWHERHEVAHEYGTASCWLPGPECPGPGKVRCFVEGDDPTKELARMETKLVNVSAALIKESAEVQHFKALARERLWMGVIFVAWMLYRFAASFF